MIERIKLIIEKLQLSQSQFAETIGINRSNLTHLFSGRNQPSLDLMKKILVAYPQIKTEWLIMGVGDMFTNEQYIPSSTVQKEAVNLDLFSSIPEDLPKEHISENNPTSLSLQTISPETSKITHTTASPIDLNEKEPETSLMTNEAILSVPPKKNGRRRINETSGESNSRIRSDYSAKNSSLQEEKKIEKVILFYDDGTFDIYQN